MIIKRHTIAHSWGHSSLISSTSHPDAGVLEKLWYLLESVILLWDQLLNFLHEYLFVSLWSQFLKTTLSLLNLGGTRIKRLVLVTFNYLRW